MGMICVLAEKPSVARDIARVLGANTPGKGCLKGGGYVVTWAVGHLVTQVNPEEIDTRWKTWRQDTLPMLPENIPLKVIAQSRDQFQCVKTILNAPQVDSVICATDAGREGELIFRRIYQMAGCRKPFRRLWISSMTEEAIAEGFANLRDGADYDGLYASALCRSDADWLVGMNGSRAFTLRYDSLLSVGRVQTPTLSILVKRALEIRNFVPENYWEVQADFGGYRGTWIDKDGKTRIPDEKTAKEIVSAVTGREGEVLEVSTERKRVPPPLLYDLTTLQREANARYGFTAQKTLNLAQALYEKHKLLTYPRTDSRYLSHDMRPKVQGILKGMPEPLRALVLSPDKAVDPGKRVYDDAKLTDHHAIIPTGRRPGALTADEQKLYEMVARQLIAAFYPDMEYDAMSAVTGVGEHKFLSRGRAVIAQGWQAANPPLRSKPKKGEEEQALPQLQKGQRVPVKSAKAVAKKTTPPSPYTENTLLAAMENAGKEDMPDDAERKGIGTPATRSGIIEKLVSSGFVERRKSKKITNLLPTSTGTALITVLPEQLQSPQLTAEWEHRLKEIERGEIAPDSFMDGIAAMLHELVQTYKPIPGTEVLFPSGREVVGKCPRCGAEVTESPKGFFCENRACSFVLWKNSRFFTAKKKVLTKSLAAALLKNGRAPLKGCYSEKTGKTYDASVLLEDDGQRTGYKMMFDNG